jgi:hypothetical protein
MTDNNNEKGDSGIHWVIEGLKRSFKSIDDVIHQAVMSLCLGNRVSPHFAVTWIATLVGSAIILLGFFGLSLLRNAVSLTYFLEIFNSQPTSVRFFVGVLAPFCWCTMLGFVSHNNRITLCEAASRGVRITLYLIAALYLIIFALM